MNAVVVKIDILEIVYYGLDEESLRFLCHAYFWQGSMISLDIEMSWFVLQKMIFFSVWKHFLLVHSDGRSCSYI